MPLAFVPVVSERYEIAIRKKYLSDSRVVALCEAISSEDFKEILHRLGGYDTKETGVQHELP